MRRYYWTCIVILLHINSAQAFQNDYSFLKDIEWQELTLHFDSIQTTLPQQDYANQLHQSLAYTKKNNLSPLQSVIYFYLGNYHYNLKELAEANYYFQTAKHLARDNKQQHLLAETHMYMGFVLANLGRKQEELENYLKAYNLFLTTDSLAAANAKYTITNLYYSIGNYAEAVEHGHVAREIYSRYPLSTLSPGERLNYMSLLNSMGLAFRELSIFDSAIYYLEGSIEMADDAGNTFWQTLTKGNLGSVYLKKGEYEKAKGFLQTDYNSSLEFEEWGSAANAAISLGEAYMKENNLGEAKVYYDKAKALIDKHNIGKSLKSYYDHLYQWNEAMGQYQQAFEAHLKYIHFRDSLQQLTEKIKISQIQAAYDFDKQSAEIELLTKNNELQENAIRKQTIIIVISAILLLFIVAMSVYMFYSLKMKKRDNKLLQDQKNQITKQREQLSEKNKTIQNINENLEKEVEKRTKKLKQVNDELDTFLYRASHDIRQPIATILGLESLAQKFKPKFDMKTILEKLNTTAKGMDLMLAKLQMLYRLNHDKQVALKINVRDVIDESLKVYQETIERNGITIKDEIASATIVTNPELLGIITRNIIENAIAFTPKGSNSFIRLSSKQTNTSLILEIADNGYGIESEFKHKIFDAYFKGNEHSKGNGLGLYLAKKAGQMLKVKISVESEPGKGTTFSIQIPTKKS